MGANIANQTSPEAETTTLTAVGVNTLLPVDKIVKAHGLEAAGSDLGHDSVTNYAIDIVVRDPVSGDIVDVNELRGTVEVGSPYERSQTTALPLTALLYDLGGINNPAPRGQRKPRTVVHPWAGRLYRQMPHECLNEE